MTIITSASLTPATGAEAMYNFKQLLVAAGWVVVSSSNGTTLQAGDLITSGAVLANANAYFVVKQPLGATGSYGGVRRELGFQRTTTNLVWRITYTHSSASTNGGSATVMPNDTGNVERRWIFADGAAGQTLFATDNTYRWHCVADNEAPYGFWAGAYPIGGGNPTTMILMDPMISGSFPHTDNDPYVFYAGSSNVLVQDAAGNNNAMNQVSTASLPHTPKCWLAKGVTGESFTGIGIPSLSWYNAATITATNTLGTNPSNAKDDVLPVFWARQSAAGGTTGFKGFSSLLRAKNVVRSTGDTLSTTSSGSKDWICMRDYVVRWDGSTPTV